MKLHLPKMLLGAVLACMLNTQAVHAAEGWAYENPNDGTGFYKAACVFYTVAGDNGDVDATTNTAQTQEPGDYDYVYIRHDQDENTALNASIGTLTAKDGQQIIMQTSRWGQGRSFELLTIDEIETDGSISLMALNAENTFVINAITGNVSGVINSADLTLGSASSSISYTGSITNTGKVTLNGEIHLTSTGNYTLHALGSGSTYSSADGKNGFLTNVGSTYYLIDDRENSTENSMTLLGNVYLDGELVQTTTVETETEKGIIFTGKSSTDNTIYHVNTTVNSNETATATFSLNTAESVLNVSGTLSNSRIQYKAGAVNVNGNTLLLDTATSDVSSVLLNTTGSGTVQLAVNAQINNNEATKATGKLQISNGAELTVGNKDLKDDTTTPAANINSFTSLELDNGKLNINTRTLGLKNVTVTGNGGRIHMQDIGSKEYNAVNLAGTTTLNGDLKLNNFYNAQINVEKLAGSGKLVIEETSRLGTGGETLKVTVSGKDSGYTGEVQVTNSADRLVVAAADDLGLNIRYSTRSGTMDLSSIGSGNTVILNGAAGGIKAGTIAADVKLENTWDKAGVEILTAEDNDSITYTGKISGNGANYLINATKTVQVDDGNGGTIEQQVAVNTNTTFSGDTSEWTGQMRVITGEQNITFTGDATTSANSWVIESGATANVTLDHAAAATVKKNIAKGNGTLNLTVKNSSTEGTTLNAADVNALSVGADTKLSLAGAAEADSVTIAESASLNFAGGSLTTSDSLTLNAISIDFSKYATTQLEHTLVSASSLALGASVNLESLGSTVGAYTATISQNGGELLLTYTVTPAETIDWSITDFGGYDPATNILTLNVGADLTGYDFTQNGTIIIPGISDSIMKEILGLTGLPEDGMVGIQLMGADGQGLTAAADQQIGFLGKDGVSTYFGQNVDGNWQYFVQYIPEPATATLSLAALMMLAARRRRRA